MRQVYWLGGGSGAGKSTTAARLAARHGLTVYATDDTMADHATRTTPDDAPYLHRFLAMDMDERWLRRSPREMVETFHWFRGEGFGLILDDLERMSGRIIVEGFRLLPRLVAPLAGNAVWLLPTPRFREAAFAKRGVDIPGWTSDPERTLANLLERDRLFTEHLAGETRRLGLTGIDVDLGVGEDELADRVSAALDL
ncbi:hypothetical protein [Actinophytocola oryzae]|uniref:AAA domain-containing protein n=1 Tax=Actinophytocola oryzae TaxID=502181 RepID=A0A4R7V3Y0_9PSEU|nr:hypothetical protein [Actinophytocola oryzae]TDV42186.1 hypothetical protein CLV71_11856 [Actinophytocola oryzae]